MSADAPALAAFYGAARGAVVARLLRERMALMWPSLAGQSVLGLGYATPYLRLWRNTAERCIAVTPEQIGLARWPAEAPNLTCSADEGLLPFPDLSFDRVLIVHGLEAAENARRLLREAWRVLRDSGRLLVVAPNRRGMWAYAESTPFGQGRPYSATQIDRLLTETMFFVEARDSALFMPPVNLRLVLRSAPLLERAGRRIAPQFAGVTLTEAVKDVYAAMPIEAAVQRRKLFLADAA